MSERCRYFLARNGPGFPELVDGCHDSPEGVAKAAKLLQHIFEDEGPWVMAEIHPFPDLDPSINERAAADCRRLVKGDPPPEGEKP